METILLPLLNLVIFAGLLLYFARKPLQKFVADRHGNLKTQIHDVQNRLNAAQKEFDDFTGKLKAVEGEMQTIKEAYSQNASQLRSKILEDAKEVSSNMIGDAKDRVALSFAELRSELSRELGMQVVEESERMISSALTGDDRARFRKEFSLEMEGVK